MSNRNVLGTCVALVAAAWLAAQPLQVGEPPTTRTDNVKETLHGVEIVDPYRWLEDQNSAETRGWIGAQNSYTHSILERLPGRDALSKRLAELLRVDLITMPEYRGGRCFFSKRAAGQEQSVLAVRRGPDAPDEVLVDPLSLAADGSLSVIWRGFSQDGTLAAYGIRQGGEDEVEVRFLDVDSKTLRKDELPRGRYGSISFRSDKNGFFYTAQTREGPRLRYHKFGTGMVADATLFGSDLGPSYFISSNVSRNGRYLTITTNEGSAATITETYIKNLETDGPITPLIKGIRAAFSPRVVEDRMYVQTNWNAPNDRILLIDLKQPARENWKEIIPESQAAMRSFTLVGGKLFVAYLDNVQSRVRVFSPDGRPQGEVPLPAIGNLSGVSGEWERNEAFYSFTSFHIPATIYRLDAAALKSSVWWKPATPIDSAGFEVKQVWYNSKDGTRVPMFLFHRKGLKLDGANPALLTGYGGFRLSSTPSFSALAAVWAEHGGVYALANLRGGGEFGEKWHEAGMLDKKQNVFDDFIAAAQWLIANHYTKPARLAVTGRSNGGLLVGAALTRRPDLYQAVICGYPLLDMLRYQKFLIARLWVPEYGSSADPRQFPWLRAYSPYQNVKPGARYPSVMFVSGDSDTRVDPLHARKMTALLQASTGSGRPILLLYDTKGGHSDGMTATRSVEVLTDELSYLFWQLGVK